MELGANLSAYFRVQARRPHHNRKASLRRRKKSGRLDREIRWRRQACRRLSQPRRP